MSFSALDYSCLDGIDIGGFVDGSDCSYLTSSQLCRLEFQPLLNSPDQSEPSSSRFAEPVTKQTLVQLKEATTPSGTSTRTATIANWAYSMWQEWARSRNELSETYGEVYPCVPVSLHDTIAEEFDFWLACFFVEVRRKDGKEYPPCTLYQIGCGILRKLRELGRYDLNFLDETNATFVKSRACLDAVTQQKRKYYVFHT